jgi:hypothetical protein
VDASPNASPEATQEADQEGKQDARQARPAGAGWLRSVSKIVVFYIAAPIAVYYLLRSAGLSPVAALLLGGVLPAGGVAVGVIRQRRLDVAGALVLAGIVVGAVLGLISHSARPVMVEGSVPTGVFGVGLLGSLRTPCPLMYGLALEFAGPGSAQGREMTRLWRYDGYRRVFRTITAVWGAAFLLEAALRIVVIYSTSTGTALALSKVTPWIWVGVLSAWTVAYGQRQKRKGERMAAAAGFSLEGSPPEEGPADGHDRADPSST